MASTREEKIRALRNVELFAGLSKRDLGYIAAVSRHHIVDVGRAVVAQREHGTECLIILDGTASVLRDGQRVAAVGPGEVIGELSLLDGLPRTATVVADTWLEVLAIDNRDFQRLLRDNATLTYKLLVSLAERMRRLTERAPVGSP